MSGKAALLFALLVALLVSGSASPPRTDGGSGVLAHKGAEPASRGRAAARVQRRAHLTEDEREMVTKQIVQALSGTCFILHKKTDLSWVKLNHKMKEGTAAEL